MAHKDNTKNAESAEKLLQGNGGAPVIEEVIAEPVVVKTGHHTGVVQTYPAVATPA
jgi:hypothetical protein